MNKKIERFENLEVGYLNDNKDLTYLIEEIGRMLFGLIKSIQ